MRTVGKLTFFLAILMTYALIAQAVPAQAAKIYVALYREGGVAVVDPASLDAWGVIKTEGAVAGLAASKDGKYLFANLINNNIVQVVDTGTDKVVKVIKVGRMPYHAAMTPDGKYLLVCNSGATNISVIDTEKLAVVREIELGAMPFDVAFSPDGRYAYIALGEEERLSVVDMEGMKVKKEVKVPAGVYDIAVSGAGDLVYINSLTAAKILVLSSEKMDVVKTIPAYGAEGLALTNDGKEIWFGGPEKNVVAYSLKDDKPIGMFLRDNQSTYLQVVLSPSGDLVLFAPSGGELKEVYVYNTATRELKGKITLPQYARYVVYIDKREP